MISLIGKPLCVVLLLTGLFSLIWLRSSIITTAYDLRTLEEKKMAALTDMKLLLAERAKLTSLDKINTSFRGTASGDGKYTAADNIFSNRVRVIKVRRSGAAESRRASYQNAGQQAP